MKKLIIFFLVAFVAQVQGLTRFDHLNKLPDYSKVRSVCEATPRAWFQKGKVEGACDFLDNEINEFVTSVKSIKNEKDWIKSATIAAQLSRDVVVKTTDLQYHDRIENAVKTIIAPDTRPAVIEQERSMLLNLVGTLVKKEIDKAIKKRW